MLDKSRDFAYLLWCPAVPCGCRASDFESEGREFESLRARQTPIHDLIRSAAPTCAWQNSFTLTRACNLKESMMYIAGFVIPVPQEKMEAYRKWAENGATLFKEYGCIEIVESWEDNVPAGKHTDFRRAVDAKDGEKIVFTWQLWPDKATLESAGNRSKNANGRAFRSFRGNSVRCQAPDLRLLCTNPHHGTRLRVSQTSRRDSDRKSLPREKRGRCNTHENRDQCCNKPEQTVRVIRDRFSSCATLRSRLLCCARIIRKCLPKLARNGLNRVFVRHLHPTTANLSQLKDAAYASGILGNASFVRPRFDW
jgi:uncharacterized protein YbaA (DUF1428 family)